MAANDRQVSSTTNVYVVAETRLLRETVVKLFRKRTDICVVGNTCFAESLAGNIAAAQADLLLLDCFDSQHQWDFVISELRKSTPEVKIVLFGMDEDPEIFLRAVGLGVVGCVLKNASAQELLDAIRSVAQGEAACPAIFCKLLFRTVASQAAAAPTTIQARPPARYALTTTNPRTRCESGLVQPCRLNFEELEGSTREFGPLELGVVESRNVRQQLCNPLKVTPLPASDRRR